MKDQQQREAAIAQRRKEKHDMAAKEEQGKYSMADGGENVPNIARRKSSNRDLQPAKMTKAQQLRQQKVTMDELKKLREKEKKEEELRAHGFDPNWD